MVRVNPPASTTMQRINAPVAAFVTPSQSTFGMIHITLVQTGDGHTVATDEDGNPKVTCTCKGWWGHKRCWHVEEALERLADA